LPEAGFDALPYVTEGFSSVTTGGLAQSPTVAQSGSPPPVTLAILVKPPIADAAGVTLIVKLAVLPGATFDRPAGTVQVTVWPATVQPGTGSVIVSPAGIVSLTVASAVVAAVPAFVTTIW